MDQPTPPDLRALRNAAIWRYLKRGALTFGLGAVALLATNLLALRIPREIGAAVTLLREASAVEAVDEGALGRAALTIALLALGAAVTRMISRVLTFGAAREIEYVLRNDLYEHLLRMPQAWYQRQATGDLVSRVVNDVTQVRLLYGIGVLHLVNTSMAYVMVLWLMCQVSVALTLTALLPYPLLLGTMRLFTQAVYRRTQASQEALSALSARAQENLSGAAVVRAFGIEAHEEAIFRDLSADYLARNLALARARGGMTPYMAAVSGIGALIVLGVGGHAVIDGQLSLGDYVEFSGYLIALSWPTIAMGWVLSVWNRGTAAFDRICEIFSAPPAIASPARAEAPPSPPGALALEDVWLRYEDGTEALRGVTLRLEPGARVALVGRTGAGKSTLAQLLARLRDPTQGRVTLGGQDLRALDLQALRGAIGFVPQDPFLFSMTALENLRFGLASGRSPGRVTQAQALQIAHLEDDIKALHQGLDTLIGERGVTLSGGQKQRLTLARAVLLDPALLILDDALSSVDAATEQHILDALDELMRGRTTLMITHRLHALERFDLILVLDQGQLVEQGTLRQLLDQGGLFAQLHQRQLSEDADAQEAP